MTEPRGPVYLCLDVELQESRLPDGFAIPDLSRYRPPAPPSGNPEAIADAAKALREARWPVLLVEGLGRAPGGPEALQSLSELLGIPVIEQGSSFNLSNLHPLNVSGASVEVLKEADLVLTVGVKDIEAALTRPEPEAGIVPAGLPISPSSGAGPRFCASSLVCPRAQWTVICNGGSPSGPRGLGRSTRQSPPASRRT